MKTASRLTMLLASCALSFGTFGSVGHADTVVTLNANGTVAQVATVGPSVTVVGPGAAIVGYPQSNYYYGAQPSYYGTYNGVYGAQVPPAVIVQPGPFGYGSYNQPRTQLYVPAPYSPFPQYQYPYSYNGLYGGYSGYSGLAVGGYGGGVSITIGGGRRDRDDGRRR